MNYCPLDEAWNLYNPQSITSSEPEKSMVQIGGMSLLDNRGGNNQSSEQTSLKMEQNQNEIDYAKLVELKERDEKEKHEKLKSLILNDKNKLCQLFLKHMEECHSCQDTMRRKFGGKLMEKFQNIAVSAPNYFEIFIVVLIGIFIIIILDSFVKLGKMMK